MTASMRLRIVLVALLVCLLAPAAAQAVTPGAVIGPRTNGENVDQVDRIARSGAEWVRIYVDWSSLEPQPGELSAFYLREYDGRVGRARAAGLKVLMVVTNSPRWASGASRPDAAADRPEDYGSIVRRMAERYAGRVSAWELWNEPDRTGYEDAARYVPALQAGYAAVKAADPAATVVLGGLTGNHYAYLERVYAAGGRGAFDAVGVHTDTACLVDGPNDQYREKDGRIGRYSFTGYREVRRTMVANGDDKPIWPTEIGWSTLTSTCRVGTSAGTRPSGVSETTQAKYLTQAYRCLQAEPYIGVAFWFSLQDVDATATESHRFGLLRDNGRPKPAYAAFRDFAQAGARRPSALCGTNVDAAAPRVRILAPRAGQAYLDSVVVSARADDGGGLGVRRMELYADGVRVPGSQAGGRFRLEWNGARRLSLGRHTLTVRASDPAGNVGEASVEVVRTDAGGLDVPPARLEFSAKRLGGRQVLLSGRVRAPGAAVKPKGKVRMFVEVRRGSRWKAFSRYSKGVARPFRLRFAVRKPGTWRVRVRYEALAPFKSTPTRVKRLGRFR